MSSASGKRAVLTEGLGESARAGVGACVGAERGSVQHGGRGDEPVQEIALSLVDRPSLIHALARSDAPAAVAICFCLWLARLVSRGQRGRRGFA